MRPADLLGRTSVRLALAFALLLIAAFAAAGAVAWGLIRQDLEAQADRRILQTWRTIATEAVDGPEELAAAVEEQLAAVADLSTVILLTDSSGATLAGNLQAFQGTAGWSNRSAMDLGLPEGSSFRLYAGPVSEGFLVVGSTDADLHEIGAIVLGALG
ncbi:hypothetical protein FHG66_11165 [Rubellimicrobium rubrum]|uniref:Uncharacterized protein n=1 Tax=Rubellimicrobium rubrum TaxID=2585369 RepID=A0A5C4MWQ2_9RHOB|nr:hypothetical protein [Rubellimicrobium rubrum]TNC49446.1 hypothetical protein FHG66_11165 [Rubellimicrobium rubrum]